jgi:hypothetical protein
VYRLINENLAELLDSIDPVKIIDPYVDMRKAVRNRSAPLDAHFKETYRKYWAMNAAHLSTQFDRKYFELLEQCRNGPKLGVPEAAAELVDFAAQSERPSVQFSFATKLVHMVKPATPVYDSNIRTFFFLRSVGTIKDPAEKLERLIADHRALAAEYDRILEHGLLTGAIEQLRAKFKLKTSVYSNTKAIDTLIWSFVSFMRRRPLGKRPVTYR